METKKIDDYFKKTQQLPLAMSLAEVKSLVGLKGATSPPKKSWWNLNNIIIMSTTIIIITTAALFFNTPKTQANYTPKAYNLEIDSLTDMEPKEKANYITNLPEQNEQERLLTLDHQSTQETILTVSENKTPLLSQKLDNVQNDSNLELIAQVEEMEESIFDPIDTTEIEEIDETIFEEEVPEKSELGGDFEGEVKTITKSISAENLNTLLMRHQNGDIEVSAWDKNEIEITATFKLKTAEPEDMKLGLNDFKLTLDAMGSKLSVGNNWDDLNVCSCPATPTSEPKGIKKLFYFPTKNKAKTDEGESFEYENFKVVYQVKIPAKMSVDITNKYADVILPEIDGDADVTVFRGDLKAKNVTNSVDLVVKYGSLQIGSFLDGDIALFRADANIGSNDRLNLKANYSTLQYSGGKELDLSAFRSDFTSEGAIDELEGSFKYGDMKLKGHVVDAELTAFRAEVIATTFDRLDLDASYTEFRADKVHQFDIRNGFRCKLKFDEVAKVDGNIKYTPLEIGTLTDMADLIAFRGDIEINQVNANFSQLDFETKYTDIDLNINPEAKYELDAKTAYSDFRVPNEIMEISHQNAVNNNSNHFIGTYNKASTKPTSKVFVDSFQGVIRLN